MTRRLPRRRRIALLAVLCLLLQHVALAAYACPIERLPPPPHAVAMHCAGTDMRQAGDNPALCANHCAPDRSTAADHAQLSVPALLLPPPHLPAPRRVAAAAGGWQADARFTRSDPPPRLRFCTLLI